MNKMIFAGYGGQGMLLCGQLLAYAAMYEDSYVTWLPSYGPEMRGGAASCSVIVSKDPIGSPVIAQADAVIAMNQPSMDKFQSYVKPGGMLLYNTSMAAIKEKREEINYLGVNFVKMAMDLNNGKVANMIALGSLNELLSCVQTSSIVDALTYKFGTSKSDLIEINRQAITKGMEVIKEKAYVS